ncbi:hypothetical protein GCM10011391_03680 [Pullulanibacillus camelliae]|uniref:Uncharacterized protein n=1 Tax=Pullulanibacillus camelliae TaxID=1707096 RepID=A0A8J2VKI0_9BACL|nr:hypothetical protein GCM10011391_03680 [Pullulanibacillus camelliae]
MKFFDQFCVKMTSSYIIYRSVVSIMTGSNNQGKSQQQDN